MLSASQKPEEVHTVITPILTGEQTEAREVEQLAHHIT